MRSPRIALAVAVVAGTIAFIVPYAGMALLLYAAYATVRQRGR